MSSRSRYKMEVGDLCSYRFTHKNETLPPRTLDRRLGGLQNRFRRDGEEKTSAPDGNRTAAILC
jgi:hypothetical protein